VITASEGELKTFLSYLTTPTLTPAGVVEIGLQINLIYQSSKAPNQEGQLKG